MNKDNTFVPKEKRDKKEMRTTLSKFGTSYDVASFEKFYDDNAKSEPAKSVRGESTNGMTNITINGKSAKLYAEVMGNLILKNGVVIVGSGKATTGDMVGGHPSYLPDEVDKVGHIRLCQRRGHTKLTNALVWDGVELRQRV